MSDLAGTILLTKSLEWLTMIVRVMERPKRRKN